MRSGHFGHCDLFTIVDIENNEIKKIWTLQNVEHHQGGCLVPVNLLHENNVDTIIVGGMGLRPLMGFRNVGIEVLLGEGEIVKDSVNAYLEGKLLPMGDEHVCGGH
jgi:predicted Fe-Mo cluster-binding NifX family protein